jgi:propanediol dehydratase large subunit
MNTKSRAAERLARAVRLESLISPDPDLGLVAMNSPNDPEPSLVIEDDIVTELDGKAVHRFDLIDRFVVTHGLDLQIARTAMSLPDEELALMLVDVKVSRKELVRLSRGLTPAKLATVASKLDPVEMMFAMKKLRARRRPRNQAHVTNRKENPALLAADAAEAAARGFAEIETTVGVSRYAPLNAISILVGSQAGRPGVLTQCAVEERRSLQLGIQGLTTYAETLSVYGTDDCFIDGDDTPWSKAFLASAYASRGVKVRFTSGSGSEALMGHSEGKSMLYLEARCLSLIRASGSQGVQNGGISTVALPLALPGGSKSILAENMIAAWLDLEVASGNDAIASHSSIRKTAKLMGQFLPGTDFVTSGYSVMPKYDNMFGGGNYDSDDLDEWTTIQRDWQVDAGVQPLSEEAVLEIRRKAAQAIQGVFDKLGFPQVTSEEVDAAVTAYTSQDIPDRDRAADLEAADSVFSKRVSGVDVARALVRSGFSDIAEAVLGMQRLRVSADYLQTSAVVGDDGVVESAINDPNDYTGPGSGHQLTGDRWDQLQALPHEQTSTEAAGVESTSGEFHFEVLGVAKTRHDIDEVVIGIGPAFLRSLRHTIGGLEHSKVLEAMIEGVRSQDTEARLVQVRRTSDVAFIAHDAAVLSGSNIGIGIQSKGTAVIHRADLEPLDNLELFGMAPLLTLDSYRAIGRNAAAYARFDLPSPVPAEIDNFARVRHIVRTTLMHSIETDAIVDHATPIEIKLLSTQ